MLTLNSSAFKSIKIHEYIIGLYDKVSTLYKRMDKVPQYHGHAFEKIVMSPHTGSATCISNVGDKKKIFLLHLRQFHSLRQKL